MRRTKEFSAKTAEFDRRLLEFFEDWRSFVEQRRGDVALKHTDWLEDFCSYVWDSLVCFEELGRLKKPLRPQGGRKDPHDSSRTLRPEGNPGLPRG